jgi:hypothetical protein
LHSALTTTQELHVSHSLHKNSLCKADSLTEHTDSIKSFLQALAGEISSDALLDKVADSLFNGKLPDLWRKLAPATCKRLGPWMDHFDKRIQQYTLWVKLMYMACSESRLTVPGFYARQFPARDLSQLPKEMLAQCLLLSLIIHWATDPEVPGSIPGATRFSEK